MAASDHLSKMVMQRKRLGQRLRGAIEWDASKIASGFSERLAEHPLDRETMPDVELFVGLLGRMLARQTEQLKQADDEHGREMLRGKRLRRLLAEATTALYRPMVEVRREIVGLYGADLAADTFRFGGRTARDPGMLCEQAAYLVQNLGQRHALPPSRTGAAAVDTETWLTKLQPPLEHLEATRDQADAAECRREASRDAKRQAIADFDDASAWVLRGYLLLLELAGETSHADRQRRHFRRPHRFRHQPAGRKDAATGLHYSLGWLASLWGRFQARWRRCCGSSSRPLSSSR